MKKKRWTGMLLVFVLLFALAGCGATGQAQNEKKNETEATPKIQETVKHLLCISHTPVIWTAWLTGSQMNRVQIL